MKPVYYTVEQTIDMIDEPNRSACQRILKENRALFQVVQGSTSNHQNWPGGYFDHIQEVMNLAVLLYSTLSAVRPLPFSLSDLLLVVFCHDLEKPWKYVLDQDGKLQYRPGMETKADHNAFRIQKLSEYGVQLKNEHLNGITYAEGEITHHDSHRRVMGPLACAAHMCDVASARLWFDFPLEVSDPWSGARRHRD